MKRRLVSILKELQFAMTSPKSDVPEFLTGDIREDIVYFSYDEKHRKSMRHMLKTTEYRKFLFKRRLLLYSLCFY